MPVYIYKHPDEESYVEVLQTMTEDHVYFQDGLEWKRVFTVPNASIDTTINEWDKNGFIEKTGNMKGTVGDMLDFSSELSEKRASRTGEDPIKRKAFDDYEKKIGKKHLMDKKKVIETSKFKIDLES